MRVAQQDYPVKGSTHIIRKGTTILIPIFQQHNNARIFKRPNKFDPERFTKLNIESRHPFAYIPLGEGEVKNDGDDDDNLFGLIEIRVGLATLLRNFRFRPTEETPIILEFNPTAPNITMMDDCLLSVESL